MSAMSLQYAIGYTYVRLRKLHVQWLTYPSSFSGLQLLSQIIIADITSMRYRGMVSALISAPFLINGFIASNIYSGVIAHANWRWGYGML